MSNPSDRVLGTPPTNTSKTDQEPSAKELAARLATQQQQRERALKRLRKLRMKARNEIEKLLEFLDASDLDPDLEPSLGWPTSGARSFDHGIPDLEAEPEHDENEPDDEHGGDDEPNLGSMGEQHLDQTLWSKGDRRDLELDDGDSGIADADGLDEQVPFRDWQGVGMV